MNPRKLIATAAAALSLIPAMAGAVEVVRTENTGLDIGGRLQAVGMGQYFDDSARSDARMYMFLKQARLSLDGNYSDLRFRTSIAFGGEDEVKAPTPGISLGLMDLFADVPLVAKDTYLRVGQFKVPYSRERLTDSGLLLFSDRSIDNQAFRVGRDVGVAVHTKANHVVGVLGVFTGGGRDIPERYLPQRLGIPLLSARIGYDLGMGENAFTEVGGTKPSLTTIPVQPDRVRAAFFLNGIYTQDSLVGHSSVLNTKVSEKSLILNGNWNPYIGKTPFNLGKYWQVGGDAVAKAAVGPGTLSGELEANYGVYQNGLGDIRVPGSRVQVAYGFAPVEVAVRYAVIMPDENFINGTTPITGKRAIQEVTPSITWELSRFNAKLVADLPVVIGAPIVQEPGIGGYILTEMPDQAAVASSKSVPVGRQNVVEGRLMFQAAF